VTQASDVSATKRSLHRTYHCFDASALVKLVRDEPQSEEVRAYAQTHSPIHATQFSLYEALSVLKRLWQKGHTEHQDYLDCCWSLVGFVNRGSLLLAAGPDSSVMNAALQLVDAERIDLSDALQIVSIEHSYFWTGTRLEANTLCSFAAVLVTADRKLAKVTERRHLRTWLIGTPVVES